MKKIFWGWYIVAATLIFSLYNSTMFAYGFTAFMNPIAEALGWGFAQISLASSIRGMEIGALDPFVGWAADRWPARRLIIVGVIVMAVGIFIFGRATNLVMFYLGFVLAGLGSAMGVSMVPTTVVSRWFKKNIGKASGILSAGVAMGGLFTPVIVKGIDAFGWQNFIMYMAFGLVIIGVPMSFLFRNKPQDYGLLPDGKTITDAKTADTIESGTTTKQALKTRAFWYMGVAQMLQMVAIHSVAVHQIPYLTSLKMTRPSAALAVTIMSAVMIGARLAYGVLADILPKRYVLAISGAITTVGLVIFGFLDGSSFAAVAVFAVIYAIGASGGTSVRAPVIREYFGIKNFGAIFGVSALMVTVGSAIGAPMTGWVYDTRGTYFPVWYIHAGLTLAATVLYLLLPRYLSPDGKTAAVRP